MIITLKVGAILTDLYEMSSKPCKTTDPHQSEALAWKPSVIVWLTDHANSVEAWCVVLRSVIFLWSSVARPAYSGISLLFSGLITDSPMVKACNHWAIIHWGSDHVICPQMNSIRVCMQRQAFTNVGYISIKFHDLHDCELHNMIAPLNLVVYSIITFAVITWLCHDKLSLNISILQRPFSPNDYACKIMKYTLSNVKEWLVLSSGVRAKRPTRSFGSCCVANIMLMKQLYS